MLVLCYGIPKSGSTLAFELVKGVLQSAGLEQETFVNDRLGPERLKRGRSNQRNYVTRISKQKLKQLIAEIGPDRKIAVKTHSTFSDRIFPWLERMQADGQLQVIASYRDPREICLSLMDAGAKARKKGVKAFAEVEDLERARENVQHRVEEFRRWGALRGTLRLSYNTVAFSPDEAINRIENALHITCDHEVAKRYAFEIASTQKNKAEKDRYLTDLTESQNTELLNTFAEFIEQACERDEEAWFKAYRRGIVKRGRAMTTDQRKGRKRATASEQPASAAPATPSVHRKRTQRLSRSGRA